jgi:hypothetical protein
MPTAPITADRRYLVVASICDCGGVALSVLDGCYDPGNLTPDENEVLLRGTDWRPLVVRAARELQESTGVNVLARCSVAYASSSRPDQREVEDALENEMRDVLYGAFPNGKPKADGTLPPAA